MVKFGVPFQSLKQGTPTGIAPATAGGDGGDGNFEGPRGFTLSNFAADCARGAIAVHRAHHGPLAHAHAKRVAADRH